MFKSLLLVCLLIAAVNASGVGVAPAVVPAVNYGYGRSIRGSYLRDNIVSNYAYNDGGYYGGYYGYPGHYGYNGLGYAGLGYGGYRGYPGYYGYNGLGYGGYRGYPYGGYYA